MCPSYPARHALDNFSPRWVSSSSSSELWPHRSLLWSGQWSQRGWLWGFLRRVLEFLDGVAWGKIQALPSSGYLKNSCECLRRRSLPWGSTFFHAPTNPTWVCLRLKDASKFYCHMFVGKIWGFEPSDFRACLRQKKNSIHKSLVPSSSECLSWHGFKSSRSLLIVRVEPNLGYMGCFVSDDVLKIGCNGKSTRYNENHLQSVVAETLLGMVLEKSHRDLLRENTISQQRVLLLLQAL